jgi:hypothetical protein
VELESLNQQPKIILKIELHNSMVKIFYYLENYNLAYTQKLKNKDIAESGSKGTILLR